MAKKTLVILPEDHQRFSTILEKLRSEANASFVFLLDRNGQQITSNGAMEGVDPTALASLAAGTIAATEGLGEVIGEQRFQSLYHEGDKASVHLTLVRNRLILLVVFDEHSSLGLVRLRVDETIEDVMAVLESMDGRENDKPVAAGGNQSPELAEITDEDIDALFG